MLTILNRKRDKETIELQNSGGAKKSGCVIAVKNWGKSINYQTVTENAMVRICGPIDQTHLHNEL